MKQTLVRTVLVLVLSCSMVAQLQAAQNKPVELAAETIEYDTNSGIMTAQGNVRIVQENAVMTGGSAQYNSKTQETHITGGVLVVKGSDTLSAAEVHSYNNTHLVATGNPILSTGDSTLTGPQIDYYSDKQYALVEGWANLKTADSVLTANKLETFFAEDRAVAQGNVHITSETRKLEATADHAVYYGSKEQQGKTILTGNARAVQDGNVLTGSTMTLFLDKKAIDVNGRSKLVITPES